MSHYILFDRFPPPRTPFQSSRSHPSYRVLRGCDPRTRAMSCRAWTEAAIRLVCVHACVHAEQQKV
jgi:hypothetical protein